MAELSDFDRPRGPRTLKDSLPLLTLGRFDIALEHFARLHTCHLVTYSCYFYLNKFLNMETFTSNHIKLVLLAINKS